MSNPWTIPFDGVNYLCWKDKNNTPQYRKMTREEENTYFTTTDKDKYLHELLRS